MTDVGFKRRPLWQTAAGGTLMLLTFVFLWIWRGAESHPSDAARAMSALFAVVLLGLSVIDLDRYLLLDAGTLPLIVLGVCWTGLAQGALLQSTLGAVVGYAVVSGLAWIWRRRFGREGIGLGDAKLLAALGAWLGVVHLPILLTLASGLGLAAALSVQFTTRAEEARAPVPFGPFLALAGWALWCAPIYSV